MRMGSSFKLWLIALTCTASNFFAYSDALAEKNNFPREPTRQLSFEVDEGTWMSVDISPDDKTLVFDILGDLFTLPVAGGEAKLIRGGMAYETQPVFSPDGRSIAYISDASGSENVWIANADGSSPQRISEVIDASHLTSPEWSADGIAVYASKRIGRHDAFELWRYNIDGGTGSLVFSDAASHALGVTASADGKYLYLASLNTANATLYAIPAWKIVRHQLKTGTTSSVVTALTGAFRPQLSPDGVLLAYATRMDGQTALRLRNLVTGEDKLLAYPIQRDNRDVRFNSDLAPGYTFTKDGKSVIAAYGGKLRRISIASNIAKVIPFHANMAIDVSPYPRPSRRVETGPVKARLIQDPALSPDGRTVVFSAFAKLYSRDLKSGRTKLLMNSAERQFQPTWSPDGRWISFVSWDAAHGGAIWKVAANGGKPQRLTPVDLYYSNPVFSPDGKLIYALSSSNFERMRLQEEVIPRRFPDLVKVSVNGGKPQIILHAGIGAERPFVTNDPDRVFFTTPEGVKSVLGAGIDGEDVDERLLARVDGLHPWSNGGFPFPVSDVVYSPDRNWLLAISANQLYLSAVPPMEPETPVITLVANPKYPLKQISRFGADYYGWSDDGRTLYWAVGSSFYRQQLSSVDFSSPSPITEAEMQELVTTTEISVEHSRDVPDGVILLRGATAITMKGDEVIPDADILIVKNRIAGIGPRDSLTVSGDAKIIEMDGKYITPGFVDTHAHWYEIRHDVLDLENWSFRISLAYGVTSGLDPQAMDQDMFAYQDMLDAGMMIGPRAWSVGQGMFPNTRVSSAQEADDLVRKYAEKYRTLNIKSYLIGDRQQRQWIVNAAEKYGLIVTTEGDDDYSLDITHALDGFSGNEHSLPVVPLYDDVIHLFADTRISYTPTLMIVPNGGGSTAKDYFFVTDPPHDDPKTTRFMPHYVKDTRASAADWVRPEEQLYVPVAKSVAEIYRAGGLIGVGSHAEFQGLIFHWEMEALTAGGLTPHEVLQAATRMGSIIIGRSEDIGTLESGKLADLLVLEKNPIENIRNTRSIKYVIKNGRVYDGDTLDEVWPNQRQLSTSWHHEDLPESVFE